MASVDKIYGTNKQFNELWDWINENKPEYVRYFYSRSGYSDGIRPITNFPIKCDMWLLQNCDLEWVVERIKAQYEINSDEELIEGLSTYYKEI